MTPLVSIIIPTYNRAHLICETLDSIIAQTYTNWGCIVVDDGSIDETAIVMNAYINKDSRFQLHKRPTHKPKGANACRNIGLEYATGDYVVFFDSDDLMSPNHLEVKVSAMQIHNCDYVITKTKFIDDVKKVAGNNYRFNTYPLTAFNYVSQALNWLTYDVCIKAKLAKSIQFNELLQSGQEYNYFSKLVHVSINAQFIDEIVTLRRYHETSIRSKLDTSYKKQESAFRAKWYTYCDLITIADIETKRNLLAKCVTIVYDSKQILTPDKIRFLKAIFKEYKWKGSYFLLMLLNRKLFNRGYIFFKKLTVQN